VFSASPKHDGKLKNDTEISPVISANRLDPNGLKSVCERFSLAYRPISVLNLSQASLSVLNTAAAIILYSVVAVVGISSGWILTLFGSTRSVIEIFFQPALGQSTVSRLPSKARRLSALEPRHAVSLRSTLPERANFSSSTSSAAALAARRACTAAAEFFCETGAGPWAGVDAGFLAIDGLADGFAAFSALARSCILVAPPWPPSTASRHTTAASAHVFG